MDLHVVCLLPLHVNISLPIISPIAFWGAAIVIFLAKIINLHNEDRQGFWVEVSSQVENGELEYALLGLEVA